MAVRKTKAGLNLKRWFKEEWRTLSGDKDYSDGEGSLRPTKRIYKENQATASERNQAEKARERKAKRERGRVSRWKAVKKKKK